MAAGLKINASDFASIPILRSLGLATGPATLESYGTTDEDVLIHTPLIHTRSIQSSQRSRSRQRPLYFGMPHALFAASCAVNIIQRRPKGDYSRSCTALCFDILAEIDRLLKAEDGLGFLSIITQATSKLNSVHQRSYKRSNGKSWGVNVRAN